MKKKRPMGKIAAKAKSLRGCEPPEMDVAEAHREREYFAKRNKAKRAGRRK